MTDLPLAGGNSTAVVRRGDHVLRTAGPWSATVQAWMAHLRAAGIDEVPEPLGFATDGREVVRFVEGTVPRYPLGPEERTDRILADSGVLLRRVHDAGRGFRPEGGVWQQPARSPAVTVLVNDYGPHNLVLRDGRVVAVIDLDQAAPGPPERDLAHLAYRSVPFTAPGNPDGAPTSIDDRLRRFALLLDAYGGADRQRVVDLVPEVLMDLAAHAGAATKHRPALPEHVAIYEADLAWFRGVADAFRP